MLASVESVDIFDNNVIAFDCSDEGFRSIEVAVPGPSQNDIQRTTDDQRNMSDKNSAYAALISNISEKDRAKDVEQFEDILRTFVNEMNMFENRFGKIRDEEKMLAVKKLMPESLLNYRFRGTTMSYSELIVALENIIVDKVAMVPTSKNRKHDTSAPMEIGMAARADRRRCESRRKPKDYRPRSAGCIQRNWQRKVVLQQRSELEREGWQRWQRWRKKLLAERHAVRKEAKGKRKAAREKPERAARQDTSQLRAGKEWTKMTVRTSKSHLRMKRICKHGVFWKRVKMSSGRR